MHPQAVESMQDELDKVQRLNREKASRLKALGIDIADLPSYFKDQLDQFVDIKRQTGLLDVNEISLEQWYQDQKLRTIDLTIVASKLKKQCTDLEASLVAVEAESQVLASLLERSLSEQKDLPDTERTKISLQNEIEEMKHKLANMQKCPDEVHLEDIMEKVNRLKALKHKS